MTTRFRLFSVLLGAAILTAASFGQTRSAPQIRLLLSEVQPGSFSADQYCTLVFTDHRFHSEKASRHHGKEVERKVYEGELSESEWNSLGAIIDSKELVDLRVPSTVPPLIMQDTHPYNISIERHGEYQNMEFLDGKSLKPYEPQIKPLLQWWKSLRSHRIPESNSPPNPSCSLDSTHGVFGQ